MEFESALALAFLIIGILMLLAEAATPGSFIIVPATVLIVLGIIGLINPEWFLTVWSPIIAVIVLVPMTYIAFRMYQMLAPPAPPETTVATSLIGRKGIVMRRVVPGNIRGKVRIENDTWSATSHEMIPEGIHVIVTESRGVHVVVEELSSSSDE